MDIATGITALKSGFDIAKIVRDALKEEKVDRNKIADQLMQLQQKLLESQESLNDAADEIRNLKQRIAASAELADVKQDLEWVDDGGFWVLKSDQANGRRIPYCPLCWGENAKLVPLTKTSQHGFYRCSIHDSSHETQGYRDYLQAQNRQMNHIGGDWRNY